MLIQQELWDRFGHDRRDYAWAQLTCCYLLVRTRGHKVRLVYSKLFDLADTPELMGVTPIHQVSEVIHSSGFAEVKAGNIVLMSRAFSTAPDVELIEKPSALFHGAGPYMDDSWELFVHERMTKDEPKDAALKVRWWQMKAEAGPHSPWQKILNSALDRDIPK